MPSLATTKPTAQRDYFFDNLRFFLIFCVVLCHGIETIRGTSEIIATFHEIILCFCMPLFVYVTGYFAKSMAKHDSPKRSKIINICLLYLICQVIKCSIYGGFSLLRPSYANWFLIGLIVWYFTLPAISKFKPKWTIAITVVFAVIIGTDPHANDILQLSRVIGFFPFFLLGYYTPKDFSAKLQSNKFRIIQAVIFILGIAAYLFIFNDFISTGILHSHKSYSAMHYTIAQGMTLKIWWYVFAALMSFGVLSIIPRKKYFFSKLGARTLPIYIIHTILYRWITCCTDFFDHIAAADNTLIICIVFSAVVTLVCSIKIFDIAFNKFMGLDFKFLYK